MRAPAWWWHSHPNLPARLLAPLGTLYGAATATRMARDGQRAGVPVLCVGNLVAGGAGKTPTALALVRILQASGARPAFLSRGYGRQGRGEGVLRVEIGAHRASEVGDEPLLLAALAPTFVSVDRPAAARAAASYGADVLVLDDGLQNPSLVKDLSFAVVDGAAGVGNGLCLPAGPLRAPVGRQWPSVSAVCVIGAGEGGREVAALARVAGKPVFTARLVPDPAAIAGLRGSRLLAFAGIGRPGKFAETLRAEGLEVVALREFPDHHAYTPRDCADLVRDAAAAGARLVTTSKDRVRLPPDFPSTAVPVTLRFDRPDEVAALIVAAWSGGPRKPAAPPAGSQA